MDIGLLKEKIAEIIYETDGVRASLKNSGNVVYPAYNRLSKFHADNYRLQAEGILLFLASETFFRELLTRGHD